MPETISVIAAGATVFVAAAIQGTTGFGFVIVAAPVLTMFIDPQIAVPVLVLQGFLIGGTLLARVYKVVELKRIWLLVLSGLGCVPVGTYALIHVDPAVIRILIGMVVGVTAIGLFVGARRRFTKEKLASIVVGGSSGLLVGSTGLAGAPVILFFTNQAMSPNQFRANITMHLQAVSCAALISFLVSGVLNWGAVTLTLQLLPAGLAGLVFGMFIHGRVSERIFRWLAFSVLFVAVGGSLSTGFSEILA